MGLINWLFGSGSKPEAEPQKPPEPVIVAETAAADIQPEDIEAAAVADFQPEAVDAATASDELNPEIVAAIAASLDYVMGTSVSPELLAAISAAVIHHAGGAHAARIKPGRSLWAMAGRQALMDSRRFA